MNYLKTLPLLLILLASICTAQDTSHEPANKQDIHRTKRTFSQELEFEAGRSSRALEPPEVEASLYWLTNTKFGGKFGIGTYAQYIQVTGALNEGRFGVGPTISSGNAHLGAYVGVTSRGQLFVAAEVKKTILNRKFTYMPEFALGNNKPMNFHQRFSAQIIKNVYFHGDSLRVTEEEKLHHIGRVGIEYRFKLGNPKVEYFVNPDMTTQKKFGFLVGARITLGHHEH